MKALFVLLVVLVVGFVGFRYMGGGGGETPSAPPPSTVQPAAAPLDVPAITAQLEDVARKIGVALAKVEPKGARSLVVTVEWTGDVMTLGGDFVTEAVLNRKIARDFDNVPAQQPMWMDPQGKRHLRALFELKF